MVHGTEGALPQDMVDLELFFLQLLLQLRLHLADRVLDLAAHARHQKVQLLTHARAAAARVALLVLNRVST